MKTLAIPVLNVSSSGAAEAFYAGQLGFEVRRGFSPHPEREDPCYMVAHRDGLVLHLSSFSGDSARGAAAYLRVECVDEWFEELIAKGVPIDLEPTDQTWGNREMYVRDPDGNALRFVEELA